MNISNTTAVQAASAAAQSPTADGIHMLVLKKALNAQAQGAAQMIQALPQMPPVPTLASQGSVGTKLNTFA